MATATKPAKRFQSFALWNNKGGVGKSTITFHLATRFAERHSDHDIFVIDLCPQANSSMMLLGGGHDGETRVLDTCKKNTTPPTVVGYIASVLSAGEGAPRPKWQDFVIRPADSNREVAKNLFLLCGDGNLEPMAPLISQRALQASLTAGSNPWKWVHLIIRNFIEDVRTSTERPVAIFVDTNPSFSIYTEIAISAVEELLVPTNADDASRVAANAMFALIYGASPPHPIYGKYTYASIADKEGISRPTVKLIVGNRLTQYDGAAKAFQAISDATADSLYSAYKASSQRFSPQPRTCKNLKEFRENFSVLLRDFNTAGVVAAHRGLPLSRLSAGKYDVYGREVQVKGDRIQECLEAVDEVIDRISN